MLKYLLSISTLILLIVYVASHYSSEVNWSLLDYVIMGVLLYGGSYLAHVLQRKITSPKMRVFALLGLFILIVFIWIELAVGIF